MDGNAAQVESTHATPYPQDAATASDKSTRAAGTAAATAGQTQAPGGGGNGIVGSVAGTGSGGGGDGKNGVKVQQRRRRSSTGLEAGRKALQHRGVGYPMTAVAAVLRQLHVRVLSVEEMKMLDQVCTDFLGPRLVPPEHFEATSGPHRAHCGTVGFVVHSWVGLGLCQSGRFGFAVARLCSVLAGRGYVSALG